MNGRLFTELLTEETVVKLTDEMINKKKEYKERKNIKYEIIKIVSAAAAIVLVIGLVNLISDLPEAGPELDSESGANLLVVIPAGTENENDFTTKNTQAESAAAPATDDPTEPATEPTEPATEPATESAAMPATAPAATEMPEAFVISSNENENVKNYDTVAYQFKGQRQNAIAAGKITGDAVSYAYFYRLSLNDFYYDVALAKAGVPLPEEIKNIGLRDITHLYLPEKLMNEKVYTSITAANESVEMYFHEYHQTEHPDTGSHQPNHYLFNYYYGETANTVYNYYGNLNMSEFTDDILYRVKKLDESAAEWGMRPPFTYSFIWWQDDVLMEIDCYVEDESVESIREEILSYIASIVKTPIAPLLPDIQIP